MPKELTHWWLAAEAVRQLPRTREVRHLLEQEQAAWLVGAVLPDTLLHLIKGPWSANALRLAQTFHEPSENSFAPLARFTEKNTHLPPAMQACLLGVAAHMEADIVFHPYICALSGNDMGLHYLYETELDLWMLDNGRQPPVRRLRELLTDQVRESAVIVAQGVFDPQGELPRKTIGQALQLHSFIQGMYGSPGWQLLASCLTLLPVPGLRCRQKLFYPLGRQRRCSVSWPEHWQQPATGQQNTSTPTELAADAVNRIVRLLHAVDETGLLAAFRQHPGENLVTGLATLHAHTPTTAGATAQL